MDRELQMQFQVGAWVGGPRIPGVASTHEDVTVSGHSHFLER